MKRCFFIALLLLLVLNISAQGISDCIFLKNGNVVKGKIETFKENQSVTIQCENGEVYTYPMLEVNRITYGQKVKMPSEKTNNSYKEYSSYETGFWFATEFQGGYSCNLNRANIAMLELDLVGGYRFNEYLKTGLGVAARYYLNNDKLRYSNIEWAFPIYLNIRGNIISSENRDIVPYYSFDIGGTIRDGYMFRPTIGARFGEPRSAFLLGLSYMGQTLKSYKMDNNVPSPQNKYCSFVTIKIGYEF
jgi:hypothetical protein